MKTTSLSLVFLLLFSIPVFPDENSDQEFAQSLKEIDSTEGLSPEQKKTVKEALTAAHQAAAQVQSMPDYEKQLSELQANLSQNTNPDLAQASGSSSASGAHTKSSAPATLQKADYHLFMDRIFSMSCSQPEVTYRSLQKINGKFPLPLAGSKFLRTIDATGWLEYAENFGTSTSTGEQSCTLRWKSPAFKRGADVSGELEDGKANLQIIDVDYAAEGKEEWSGECTHPESDRLLKSIVQQMKGGVSPNSFYVLIPFKHGATLEQDLSYLYSAIPDCKIKDIAHFTVLGKDCRDKPFTDQEMQEALDNLVGALKTRVEELTDLVPVYEDSIKDYEEDLKDYEDFVNDAEQQVKDENGSPDSLKNMEAAKRSYEIKVQERSYHEEQLQKLHEMIDQAKKDLDESERLQEEGKQNLMDAFCKAFELRRKILK